MRGDDRQAVLESGSGRMPSAARGAAAQWINGQAQLVTGFERVVGPAAPGEAVRALALEVPDDLVRLPVQDLQADEGVRARETKFLHDPDQLDRVCLIELRNGVVGGGGQRRRGHRETRPQCEEMWSH